MIFYLYGPGYNHVQDVVFAFQVKDIGKIEILSPLSENSPIIGVSILLAQVYIIFAIA